MKNQSWIISGTIHLFLFATLLLIPNSPWAKDIQNVTKIQITLPVLGESFFTSSSPSRSGVAQPTNPVRPSSQVKGEFRPQSEGAYQTLESIISTSKEKHIPDPGFEEYSFEKLLKAKDRVQPAEANWDVTFLEGAGNALGQPELNTQGLELNQDMDVTWSGIVSPLGQWSNVPQINTGNNELDLRILTWLRSLTLRADSSGEPYEIKIRIKVRLRRPE